jgi:hypothetical protein
MITEPNNTISTASASGVSSSGTRSIILSSDLNPINDVDIYGLQVNQGDTITLNITGNRLNGGLRDSILRVFDPSGNELAVNDDNQAPGEAFSLDSYIELTANSTDRLFVGVSSFANFNYNPIDGSNPDNNGFSSGNYQLAIDVFNTINGNDNNNLLSGTTRNDFIRGLGGNDLLSGGRQNDNVLGGAGNDAVNGNDGNDTLTGGDGNDRLVGGAGNDLLQGNNGIDSLRGNGGADIFVLERDFSVSNSIGDAIFDFQNGTDRILLGENGTSFSDLVIEQLGFNGGTSISLFGETIGTLIGVDASLITVDDFVT